MRAVDATSRQQLLSANHSQRLTELIAYQILAPVTARKREIRRPDIAPAREPGDESRIFVIGMRGDR
jgi:hypothetical protein